uniref:Uncharacterized protein n=1 Tax=Ananas comosus var. bracteatus TaxID=296719 RepID=A0A6V7PRS8_ANACO|nr:unnamed protein product [Ananas comosus var. bracteatus]
MELHNPSHGAELLDHSNGDGGGGGGVEDVDSSCSTPYVSAPSSPGRCGASAGWFYSAPASPMHFVLSSQPYSAAAGGGGGGGGGDDADFEFAARFASPGSSPPDR